MTNWYATHLSPGREAILFWNTHTFYEEIKQMQELEACTEYKKVKLNI